MTGLARTESDSRGGAIERLRSGARGLAGVLGDRAMAKIRDRVEGAAVR